MSCGLIRKIKIAILGSTKGTSAKELIHFSKQNENVSIDLIFTDRKDSEIINLARENKLSCIYRPKKKSETREEYDIFLCNLLKLYEIDYIFMVGYMKIVDPIFVQTFENRIFNIHPSLLPKYAGGMDISVHQTVIDNDEYISGCTLHFVTEDVDGGRIILQKECIVDTSDPMILKNKVQKLESQCLVECVKMLINGTLDEKITYQSSGVSINRGEAIVETLSDKIDNLNRFCSIQGNMALSVDGVGSKIELCAKNGFLYNAGIDLVAMSVNDILCHGAIPKYFLDYIATDRINENTDEFIKGVLEGCRLSKCKLVGGETAEMKSIYRVNSLDAAGFVMGDVIYPITNDINIGDILVGLPSNGLHANGFSLVNQVYKNETNVDWQKILKPTRIYVDEIKQILNENKLNVKSIINITGGGWMKNIPRVLNKDQFFEITHKWEIHNEFIELQRKTKLSNIEMLETFNCGIGMILVVSKDSLQYLKEYDLIQIGKIISGTENRINIKIF